MARHRKIVVGDIVTGLYSSVSPSPQYTVKRMWTNHAGVVMVAIWGIDVWARSFVVPVDSVVVVSPELAVPTPSVRGWSCR